MLGNRSAFILDPHLSPTWNSIVAVQPVAVYNEPASKFAQNYLIILEAKRASYPSASLEVFWAFAASLLKLSAYVCSIFALRNNKI